MTDFNVRDPADRAKLLELEARDIESYGFVARWEHERCLLAKYLRPLIDLVEEQAQELADAIALNMGLEQNQDDLSRENDSLRVRTAELEPLVVAVNAMMKAQREADLYGCDGHGVPREMWDERDKWWSEAARLARELYDPR